MNAVARHAGWVLVPEPMLGAFHKRLKALNAKAERAGISPITAGEPEPVLYEIQREASEHRDGEALSLHRVLEGRGPTPGSELVRMLRIPLDYPIIRLGNWRVVAQIEAVGEGENLVFTVSADAGDIAAAEAHRHQPVACEHCGLDRRRRVSYLLASDEGTKEVGQQCLEEFVGIDPAAALFLAKLQTFVAWDDPAVAIPGRNAIGTREFLANVAFLTEHGGFVSVAKARERPGLKPTYTVAADLRNELQRDSHLLEAWRNADRDRQLALADAVRVWYALNASSTGFDANVRALLASESLLLDSKHLAFAAAAVPSYQRQQQRQREQAIDTSTLAHVGSQGERSTMELRVTRVIAFETTFGPASRVLLADRQGNRLTWKTAARLPDDLREARADDWFSCQFKVKEHGMYQDVPQTVVTHLKVLGPVLACEPPADDVEAPKPC